MYNTAILSLFLLALSVGGIFLQLFLAKKTSPWPGLILPAVTFLLSLVLISGLAAYDRMTGGEIFAVITLTFLLGNIPTMVLLGVYFSCRHKMKIRAQLDKMNIQDLE